MRIPPAAGPRYRRAPTSRALATNSPVEPIIPPALVHFWRAEVAHFWRAPQQFAISAELTLHLVGAGLNKDQATRRAVDEFLSIGTAEPAKRVGLCFDPDEEKPEDWQKRIGRLAGSKINTELWQADGRGLLLLPWTVSDSPFDSLDEQQNLERVAVLALSLVHPELIAPLEICLGQIALRKGEDARRWKAAAMLWHAATQAKFPDESFYDRVFAQDPATAQTVVEILKDQPFWNSFERLTTP